MTQNVVGHLFRKWALSNDVLRENRPGGKIDASEEKGCQKEKALTASSTRIQFHRPLERNPSREVFYCACLSGACSALQIVLETR